MIAAVKIKQKRTHQMITGGGPPSQDLTPAEDTFPCRSHKLSEGCPQRQVEVANVKSKPK